MLRCGQGGVGVESDSFPSLIRCTILPTSLPSKMRDPGPKLVVAVVVAFLVSQVPASVVGPNSVYVQDSPGNTFQPTIKTKTQCANEYEVNVQKCNQAFTSGSTCAFDNSQLLADTAFTSISCCNNSITDSTSCPTDVLPTSDSTFNSLIAEKEALVRDFAVQARSGIEGRCTTLSDCASECSYKSCSTDIGATTCVSRFGSLPQCPSDGGLARNCNGRQLNFDKSSILLASETANDGTAADEFICGTRNLDDWFKAKHTTDLFWSYFGDIYGQFRNYPGYARERDSNGCKPYDPRIRPWYLAASSGPKDVVIVLDISGSMNQYVSSTKSRMTIIKETLNGADGKAGLLDTFSFSDYISIVLFNAEGRVLDVDHTQNSMFLFQATAQNIAKAKSAVNQIVANGQTDFRAGFRKAFDVLSTSASAEGHTSSCSSVILFLTDGRDKTCESCTAQYQNVHGACRCTQRMLSDIQGYQDNLVNSGGKRATIFTYSMGDGADDSVPRSIACRYGGAWGSISDGEDPLTKMTAYYKFMARSNINADGVFWTEPYADDPTGEQVTTAAKVVYESSGGKHMLGVVGVDVPLQSLDKNYNTGYQALLQQLQFRSKACWYSKPNECEMQMLRDEASCPVSLPQDSCCFKESTQSTKKFVRVDFPKDWTSAQKHCQTLPAGQLAIPESKSEYEFLSGIVPSDGAWIGLRQNRQDQEPAGGWSWDGMSVGQGYPLTDVWGTGEPNNFDSSEHCGEMDSRGSQNNMNDENCNEKRTFICQIIEVADQDFDLCYDCAKLGAVAEGSGQTNSASSSSSDGGSLGAIVGGAVGGVALLLGGGLYFKNKKSTMVSINCCSSIGGNVEHRTNQSSKVVEAEDKGRSESNSQPAGSVQQPVQQPVAMQPAYVVQQPQYGYSAGPPSPYGQPQVVQMAPVAPAYPSMN